MTIFIKLILIYHTFIRDLQLIFLGNVVLIKINNSKNFVSHQKESVTIQMS